MLGVEVLSMFLIFDSVYFKQSEYTDKINRKDGKTARPPTKNILGARKLSRSTEQMKSNLIRTYFVLKCFFSNFSAFSHISIVFSDVFCIFWFSLSPVPNDNLTVAEIHSSETK